MAAGAAKIRGLLQWCKKQVEGYPGVEVSNFTKSFRDGLAFCAIIHRYRPDLIDFYALSKENVLENNNLAYSVAEKELGIPPLLDAEDMAAVSVPDRLSVITYVSQYYNCFANKTPMGGPNVVAAEPAKVSGYSSGRNLGQSTKKREPAHQDTALSASAPTPDVCAICHKSVYMLERQHHKDHLYHRSCLRKSQVKAIGEKVKSLERGAHLKRNLVPPSSSAIANSESTTDEGVRSNKRRSPSPALARPSSSAKSRQPAANGAVRIQPNSLVGLPVPTPLSEPPLDSPGEPSAKPSEPDPVPPSILSVSSTGPIIHKERTVTPSQVVDIEPDSKAVSPSPVPATPEEKPGAAPITPAADTNFTPVRAPTSKPSALTPDTNSMSARGRSPRSSALSSDTNSVSVIPVSPKPSGDRVGTPEHRRRSRSPPGSGITRGRSAEPEPLPSASAVRHSGRFSHYGEQHHKRRAPAPPPSQSHSTPPTSRHPPPLSGHHSDSPSSDHPPARPPPMSITSPRVPSIRTMPPANADVKPDVEYPKDLNPFGDEDESQAVKDESPAVGSQAGATAGPTPHEDSDDVTFEYKGKNPFDIDEDIEETPARRPSPPALQTLPENMPIEYHGKNPFDTDSEEDTSSHDLSSISASSLRQSSHRKKRLAPPPPRTSKSPNSRPENGHASIPAASDTIGAGKVPTDSSALDSESPTNEVSPSSTNSGLVDLPAAADGETGKRKIMISVREDSPASGREDAHENPASGATSHLRKIVPADDFHASSEGEESGDVGHHRKGPAPSLPVVSRRCVRTDADEEYVPYAQLISELEQLNEEQLQLEKRGQHLEEELRNAEKKAPATEDHDAESVDVDAAVDALMVSWLELIERKNQLFRRESELHYRIRQRELEERHADIEFELRQLLAKQDNLKTADDKQREDVLLQDLQACVMERSELIYALDEDQQREMSEVVVPRIVANRKAKINIDEDKHRTRVLGPKFSNVLCMTSKLKKKSKEDKKDKKKEKKKKEKKEKKTS